jgi:hypothetical protein
VQADAAARRTSDLADAPLDHDAQPPCRMLRALRASNGNLAGASSTL